MAGIASLQVALDGATRQSGVRPVASIPDGNLVVRFLRDLKLAWEKERANLVASVHERVVVTDKGFVEVGSRRTP